MNGVWESRGQSTNLQQFIKPKKKKKGGGVYDSQRGAVSVADTQFIYSDGGLMVVIIIIILSLNYEERKGES